MNIESKDQLEKEFDDAVEALHQSRSNGSPAEIETATTRYHDLLKLILAEDDDDEDDDKDNEDYEDDEDDELFDEDEEVGNFRYTCDQCGACCRQFFVNISIEDVRREPQFLSLKEVTMEKMEEAHETRKERLPSLRKTYEELGERFHGQIDVLEIASPGEPCCALDGNRCRFYATRPDTCRRFEAGSDQCQEARESEGLPQLEPDDEDGDGDDPLTEVASQSRPSRVYFILNDESKAVHIGTTSDVEFHMAKLQDANSSVLSLLGSIPDTHPIKTEIHEHFIRYRMKGEWFRYDDYVREQIEAILQDGWPIPSATHP